MTPHRANVNNPQPALAGGSNSQLELNLVVPPSMAELNERAALLRGELAAVHRERRARQEVKAPRRPRSRRYSDAQIIEAFDKVVKVSEREYGAVKATASQLRVCPRTVHRALNNRKWDI